jgi:hypothetical protein
MHKPYILAKSTEDKSIAIVTKAEIITDSGDSEYVGITVWPLKRFGRNWRKEISRVKWIF